MNGIVINFALPFEDCETIRAALGLLAYSVAAPVIARLDSQVIEQIETYQRVMAAANAATQAERNQKLAAAIAEGQLLLAANKAEAAPSEAPPAKVH